MNFLDTHLRLHIDAMQFHVHNALFSLERKRNIIETNRDSLDSLDCQLSLLNEQLNILTQAATISRYLWPSRSKHTERGKKLREILDISDKDPLADRELRNAVEHYDEKLDIFLDGNQSTKFLAAFYGFRGALPEDAVILKGFIVDEDEFWILDKKYKFSPIALSLGDLNPKITSYLETD